MDVLVISNTSSKKSYFLNPKITLKMNFLWTDQFALHKKAFLQTTFFDKKIKNGCNFASMLPYFSLFLALYQAQFELQNELWYVRKYRLNTRPALDQVGNARLEHFCMPISLYTFFKACIIYQSMRKKTSFQMSPKTSKTNK